MNEITINVSYVYVYVYLYVCVAIKLYELLESSKRGQVDKNESKNSHGEKSQIHIDAPLFLFYLKNVKLHTLLIIAYVKNILAHH